MFTVYAAGQAVPARWRPGYVFSAKSQPGGTLVATACSDGVLRVWDLRSQQLHTVCSLPLHEGMAAACAWDAHGHCLSSIATNGSITAMVNSRCCNVMVPGWYAVHFMMLWALTSVLHGGEECLLPKTLQIVRFLPLILLKKTINYVSSETFFDGTAARLACQCQCQCQCRCQLHSMLLLSHHEKASSSLDVCDGFVHTRI